MEVSPAVLDFKGPFSQSSTEKLVLTNTSAETLAFKVKTTAPKLYCVRPNASIIQPGKSLEVSIILQGLEAEPPVGYKCKDKFLLVTLPCPYDDAETKISDLWPSLESEFKSTSKKIKVNYVTGSSATTNQSSIAQSAPVLSPHVALPLVPSVPSGSSAATGAAVGAGAGAIGSSAALSNVSKAVDNGLADSSFVTTHQQVEPSEELPQRETRTSLASLKREQNASPPLTTPKPPPAFAKSDAPDFEDYTPPTTVGESKGGIPFPIVLIIALLAFILGKYIL